MYTMDDVTGLSFTLVVLVNCHLATHPHKQDEERIFGIVVVVVVVVVACIIDCAENHDDHHHIFMDRKGCFVHSVLY